MGDMNYSLNKFDMVVVDEVFLVFRQIFEIMVIIFNYFNVCFVFFMIIDFYVYMLNIFIEEDILVFYLQLVKYV